MFKKRCSLFFFLTLIFRLILTGHLAELWRWETVRKILPRFGRHENLLEGGARHHGQAGRRGTLDHRSWSSARTERLTFVNQPVAFGARQHMRVTRRLARRVMGCVTTCAPLWLVGASPPGRDRVCWRSPLGWTGRLRRRHRATKPCRRA